MWQCRRTAPLVERLKEDGLGNTIRDRTGLIPDAYFSGTKLEWLLDSIDGARDRVSPGGRLYVVIRKQQGAPSALRHMQELYASARVIAREKGFWVIECEGKKEDI